MRSAGSDDARSGEGRGEGEMPSLGGRSSSRGRRKGMGREGVDIDVEASLFEDALDRGRDPRSRLAGRAGDRGLRGVGWTTGGGGSEDCSQDRKHEAGICQLWL
jgi:hypothetical protein